MIGRLLASAALAVALGGTAMAQMSPPPASNPPAGSNAAPMNPGPATASPGAQNGGHTMSNSTRPTPLGHQANGKAGMSGDRQTAQGQQNNVADKLNACEAKPMQERQSCINDATRGMSGGM